MRDPADLLVAVVDDEQNILESVADLLASAGYDTVTFDSAAALLEWDRFQTIDCLVSDVRMPRMDGWQLLAYLRRHQPHLPVVLVTAHDPLEYASHQPPGGTPPAQILRKPFEPQSLLDAIHRALDSAP